MLLRKTPMTVTQMLRPLLPTLTRVIPDNVVQALLVKETKEILRTIMGVLR